MTQPTRDEIVAGGFCSVKEAARRLGLGLSHTYKLLDDGVIPYVKPTGINGRARRVSLAALAHYISENLVAR